MRLPVLRIFFITLCTLTALTGPSAAQAPQAGDEPRAQCLSAHADAQMLRMESAFLAAREKLLICGQRECPGPVANDCAGWLSEVEASLSSVVFAVSDAQGRDVLDAKVSTAERILIERVDGRSVLLDPGTYVFTVSAPGQDSVARTISVRESEKNRIVRIELTGPAAVGGAAATLASETVSPPSRAGASPHPVPIASYVLGGVALVGFGGFAYFGLSGDASYDKAKRLFDATGSCAGDCAQTQKAGKREYIAADVSVAVAGASLAAAVIVFFVARPRSHDNDDAARAQLPALMPVLGTRGGGLSWNGHF